MWLIMRKRKPRWTLLYKKDGQQKVWLYEPLRKYEINARKRKGWRVVK